MGASYGFALYFTSESRYIGHISGDELVRIIEMYLHVLVSPQTKDENNEITAASRKLLNCIHTSSMHAGVLHTERRQRKLHIFNSARSVRRRMQHPQHPGLQQIGLICLLGHSHTLGSVWDESTQTESLAYLWTFARLIGHSGHPG